MSLSAAAHNHHTKRKRRLPPSALPIAATTASASALLLAVQVGGAAPRSAEARRASTGKQVTVSATHANHIDGYEDDDDADGLRAFQDTVRGRQRVRAVRRSVDFVRPLDWFNRTQNDLILASW